MNYGHALSYWRKALASRGGDTAALDKMIEQISTDADAMLTFVSMLEAAKEGRFNHA